MFWHLGPKTHFEYFYNGQTFMESFVHIKRGAVKKLLYNCTLSTVFHKIMDKIPGFIDYLNSFFVVRTKKHVINTEGKSNK